MSEMERSMRVEKQLWNHVHDGQEGGPITITIKDAKSYGGAHHEYEIKVEMRNYDDILNIQFQHGPVHETGVNGITNEVLLAIVQHRLECFQAGSFACQENAVALSYTTKALHALHERTRDRKARNVEGTNKK